jgi:hypothetical protein
VRRSLAALVCALVVLTACSDDDPVARALDALDDDDRFDTAEQAGEALAAIGADLLAEGRDRDAAPLLSASAYAQVLAVRVLDCTAPGRSEIRAALRTYLEAVADADDDDPAPEPPSPPDCRIP